MLAIAGGCDENYLGEEQWQRKVSSTASVVLCFVAVKQFFSKTASDFCRKTHAIIQKHATRGWSSTGGKLLICIPRDTMLDWLRNQWTALFQLSLPSAPLLVCAWKWASSSVNFSVGWVFRMGPAFFICGLISDHISSASVVEEFPL